MTNGRWGKSQIRGEPRARAERDAVASVLNPTGEPRKTPQAPTRKKPAEKGGKEGAETPKGAAAWNPRNFLFTTPPPAPAAPAAAATSARLLGSGARRRLGDGANGRRQIKMQKSREKAITERKRKRGGND
uniref:Uncharacterized protein n=1 Tax=Setaria italica TaxID=4555 RepID=K3Y1B9_SETIT